MIYEPRNRPARLYTVKESDYSSYKEAVTEAKQRFANVSGYRYGEVTASILGATETDGYGNVVTIVAAVKHADYRKE